MATETSTGADTGAAEGSERPPPETAPRPHSSPLAGRSRSLAIIVAIAVVAAAVGFFASRWVKSPAELAAETAPPPASIITAPVEERVVADTLVTRGTVGSVSTVNAIPAQAPAGVAAALITRIPARAGAQLEPGDVVIEISGQPVFFLPGQVPAYRNLREGDTGPDVTQLQAALRKAGQSIDDALGRYGPSTAAAVRALYTRNGYQPPRAGGLPISAVAFVNTDTSTLVVVKARVGQPASEADVQLASGDLVVFVETSAASSELIQQDAQVDLTAELINETATGTITTVSNSAGGGQATITPDSKLGAKWAGQDVRVDIAGTGSSGKVLAVPVSAVSLDGGGNATVTVYRDEQQYSVPVTVGATGDGYVQVTPTGEQSLQAGDQVVVGVG